MRHPDPTAQPASAGPAPAPEGPRDRTARRLVWALCLGSFALQLSLALARLRALHHHTFDLALYTRTAWGISGGSGHVSLLDQHFLAAHASLPLIPLGLLGRLWDTPTVLLCAQAAALSAAALPLAAIGKRRFGPAGALLGASLWLLYPNIGHVAAYEFHPGSLGVLPLCHCLDALDRRDGAALRGWALAVVACRADFALLTLALGALWQLQAPASARSTSWSHAAPGLQLIAGSGAYFALVALLLPTLVGAGGASAAVHFGTWGGSPLGLLPTLVTAPAAVLEHFSAPARLSYLPRVLLPLALLPLLRPRLLLPALPTLALNLLSSFPTTTELYSHYLCPALPALVYAALDAAHGLRGRLGAAALAPPLASVAIASALLGGLPWSRDFPAADFTADARTRARREVLRHIPAGASVQAPDPLLPHLAERERVHRGPPPQRGTDFVVLDLSHRRRFAGTGSLLRTTEEPTARDLLARPDHAVVAAAGDLLVLARGRAPRTGLAARYMEAPGADTGGASADTQRLCACLALRSAELTPTGLVLHLRARGACPADLAVRFGAAPRPTRVDLLFDGILSPANLRAGDRLRSTHALTAAERGALQGGGLWLGALRSSGAQPEPHDPYAMRVPLPPAAASR